MPFSIYDKLPTSPLPTSPFEFLAKLAEGHKQDLDKLDERIGITEGLFAKLVPAKGHEGFAKRVSDKWNQGLNNLIDKYGNNPLSREFSRELTSYATSFQNDPEVQKIIESKNFFDKNAGGFEQERYKGAIINAPGILDVNGDYAQNENLYSWDSFNMQSQADFVKPIQAQINIKRHQQLKESKVEPEGYNLDGTPYFKTTDYQRLWNDAENRKETYDAIEFMINDNTNTEQGFRYLKALANQQFPGDVAAQKTFIRETINNAGIPFNFSWTEEDEKITGVKDGVGKKGDGSESDVAKIGLAATVALDYVEDAEGNRILTTPALENLAAASKQDAERITAKENLTNVSSNLFDGDGNLLPTALVTTNDGYQLINTELIPDPIERQTADDYNMELMSLQNRQLSALEMQAYYMEKAGYDSQLPLEQQVSKSILAKAQNTGLERTPIGTVWNGNNFLLLKERIQNPDGTINKDKFASEVNYMVKTKRFTEEQGEEILATFETETSTAIKGLDLKYKNYSNMLENYLQQTVYTQGYNYSVSKSEQLTRLKSLLGQALLQRKVTRSNFGAEAGDVLQTLSDPEKKVLIKDVLEKTKDEKEDFSQMSIRFDDSTGEFVVDLVLADATYEVAGFDQQGLADIVRQQDPQLSNTYLSRKSSLANQFKTTNGRRAVLEMPVRDASNNLVENNRIVVKTALEQHGTVAKQGDYLFCFPEVGGKVFIAKNSWALIQMTDLYREAKQAGKTGDDIKNLIADGMNLYSITAVNDKQYNIGGKYFPSEKSRTSPINVEVGK